MARSMWRGAIQFGLVTIPVKLYLATETGGIGFNMLHASCGNRIQMKIYCPFHDEVVPRSRLAEATKQRATELAARTDRPAGARAAGVLLFDCVCRGLILKDGFQREIDAVREVMGEVPVAGFLTYGEIASYSGRIDTLFRLILWITGIIFVVVEALLLFFLFRYRHREGRRAHYTHGNNRVEVVWTIVPALICVLLALLSRRIWTDIKENMPHDAIEIQVTGEQFTTEAAWAGNDISTLPNFPAEIRAPAGDRR